MRDRIRDAVDDASEEIEVLRAEDHQYHEYHRYEDNGLFAGIGFLFQFFFRCAVKLFFAAVKAAVQVSEGQSRCIYDCRGGQQEYGHFAACQYVKRQRCGKQDCPLDAFRHDVVEQSRRRQKDQECYRRIAHGSGLLCVAASAASLLTEVGVSAS